MFDVSEPKTQLELRNVVVSMLEKYKQDAEIKCLKPFLTIMTHYTGREVKDLTSICSVAEDNGAGTCYRYCQSFLKRKQQEEQDDNSVLN